MSSSPTFKKQIHVHLFLGSSAETVQGGDHRVHCVLEILRGRFLNHVGVSSSHKYFLCVCMGISFIQELILYYGCLSNRDSFYLLKHLTVVGDTNEILYR